MYRYQIKCANTIYAVKYYVGKKCSYEGSVKNYFKDYRPEDLKSRVAGIENNIRNGGERMVVRKTLEF